MSRRIASALLLASMVTAAAYGSAGKHPKDPNAPALKLVRHDPAFRAGYDDGYRIGANDSEALSSSYRDESGPIFDQATDGYTPQYGDQANYQNLFRRGYIAGYKAGWDFNAGQYNSFPGMIEHLQGA